MNIKVLEIRNYWLQPAMRDHFIEYFTANFIHTLGAEKMHVLGMFRLIGEPDHYVWLRGYADMPSRTESLFAFYDGPVWKKHRTLTNSMIVSSDDVHLIRPLPDDPDLTNGQTSASVAAALTNSIVSLAADMVAIDIYQAVSGQRQTLIDHFQTHIRPAYQAAGIQLRGCFVAEMGENTFPRHPALQNEHEFVVIAAHANESIGRQQRAQVAPLIDQFLTPLLSAPPETLLLTPTLHSPLRYSAT